MNMTAPPVASKPVITATNVRKWFASRTELARLFLSSEGEMVRAVDDVSFEISQGEILGLIGESGSGKTTLGRLLVGLERQNAGSILFDGSIDVGALSSKELRDYYRDVQMIFQDPYESINPRFTVYDTVSEPLKVQQLGTRGDRMGRVEQALEQAGLKPPRSFLDKYPHEMSGGERQRLSIARALVLEPKLLIADEPVSMLDVSIRAGILNLLKRLSRELGLAILYVSHDLSTTRYLCDRIVIMYRGKFVESGDAETVIDDPKHPYAQALKSAGTHTRPGSNARALRRRSRHRRLPAGPQGLPLCGALPPCDGPVPRRAAGAPAVRSAP